MMPIRYDLWEKNLPAGGSYAPYIMHYEPRERRTDAAVLLVPGSGYINNPAIPRQEGEAVAEYLCDRGIAVFILIYRVSASGCYPYVLNDGRRAVRFLRYRAKDFDIDPTRIVTLGYSAGGHLCASLVGYHEALDGEGVDDMDKVDYVPNYQALCYPVISFDTAKDYTHKGSVSSLLGEKYASLAPAMSFETSQTGKVPPTFLFHNFDDKSVGVENSFLYAMRLRELGTPVEMHIYPDGGHGVGLAMDEKPSSLHNRDWLPRFVNWLRYNGLYR